MRIVFEPPTEEEFLELFFFPKEGGSLKDIRVYNPYSHPRGGGLFSVLGGLLRKAAPFLMKTFTPAAVEFGKGVLDDIGSGREPLKQSIKKRGLDALRGVGKKLVGGGKRRINNKCAKKRKRRRTDVYKGDVFTML